ncbi:MAG: hypothetical protein M1813_007982 [Trichoglossum hirsutum]|nr:MAG: hypothetical protein M1813_007982 [Trichoglossum hirsutum]
MVIVYYDSAVQETFEALVRGIGTARNNVRKAKMNVRMRSWSALAGSEDDGDAMRSRFILPRSSARSTGGEKTVYDTVDGLLETAQGQCETGAHQFLRDGDCRKEIESARKKLEEVRELAAEELEKLLREEEEQQKQQEEQEQQQEQGEGEEEKEEGDSREVQVEIKRQESPGDEGIEVEDDDGAEGEEYQIPLDWKRRYARA